MKTLSINLTSTLSVLKTLKAIPAHISYEEFFYSCNQDFEIQAINGDLITLKQDYVYLGNDLLNFLNSSARSTASGTLQIWT